MRSGFICLALHGKGNDSCWIEGQRQNKHKLETTCWAGEQGEGEVAFSDIYLGSDSLPSLHEQKVAVCGSFEKSM
ncbi:hypothetical protein PBY51_011436 [Eleginops maclovinus]|uniref:Uncharacterized protein n=1 Tax=Eleginops maclovinus TaxID=56733 RepID=A0AAN7XUL9_ELEMC|nr:hypothetical protein PBY51_011436 [Eleginops maclovinus]